MSKKESKISHYLKIGRCGVAGTTFARLGGFGRPDCGGLFNRITSTNILVFFGCSFERKQKVEKNEKNKMCGGVSLKKCMVWGGIADSNHPLCPGEGQQREGESIICR